MKDKAYLLRSGDEIIGVAVSKGTAQFWCMEGSESENRAYKEVQVIHSSDLILSPLSKDQL